MEYSAAISPLTQWCPTVQPLVDIILNIDTASIVDLGDKELELLSHYTKQISAHHKKLLNVDATNIVFQERPPSLLVHIVPRRDKDIVPRDLIYDKLDKHSGKACEEATKDMQQYIEAFKL